VAWTVLGKTLLQKAYHGKIPALSQYLGEKEQMLVIYQIDLEVLLLRQPEKPSLSTIKRLHDARFTNRPGESGLIRCGQKNIDPFKCDLNFFLDHSQVSNRPSSFLDN